MDRKIALLPWHKQIITDLAATPHGDGLVILSRGLGHRQLLVAMLALHAHPQNLVLLLNTSQKELESIAQQVEDLSVSNATTATLHPDRFTYITTEFDAAKRAKIYLQGGVVAASNVIMEVDLLNKVFPAHLLTGVIVNHAHRVSDASHEHFILKLIRDHNKVCFIKAISEQPESFVNGLWKLERSMKLLLQRQVFLWPRFHVQVKETFESPNSMPPDLIELRVPMTKNMQYIQTALMDCIRSCLSDIKRILLSLFESDDFSTDTVLFRSFDYAVFQHAEQAKSISPRSLFKIRQSINDLKMLRNLISYLCTYDAVSFYELLETIRASNAAFVAAGGNIEGQSQWLLLEAADTVFDLARQRVYQRRPSEMKSEDHRNEDLGHLLGISSSVTPTLEELPKWRLLKQILDEIEKESDTLQRNQENSNILIMCEAEKTCRQLRSILTVSEKTEINTATARSEEGRLLNSTTKNPVFSSLGVQSLLIRLGRNYFKWKSNFSSLQRQDANTMKNNSNKKQIQSITSDRMVPRIGGQPPNKRRRVRGGSNSVPVTDSRRESNVSKNTDMSIENTRTNYSSKQSEDDVIDLTKLIQDFNDDDDDDENSQSKCDSETIISKQNQSIKMDAASLDAILASKNIIIRSYRNSFQRSAGGSNEFSEETSGEDDIDLLTMYRPKWVIMYDPDVGFVRRLEVYNSWMNLYRNTDPSKKQSDKPLRIYFMTYDNSIEEQRYLSMIRFEKIAFEKLIRENSNMAPTMDQDGRTNLDEDHVFYSNIDTRLSGGQVIPNDKQNTVIVDSREFRSGLPAILYFQGLRLVPATLEVGDYVLTPSIVVERKALPDLIQSFKSGRLYTQCEMMTLTYEKPFLLIEYQGGRRANQNGWGISGLSQSEKEDIQIQDVQSKLVLLLLAFPKVRLLWSSRPENTAKIFLELKKNRLEPDLDEALRISTSNPNALLSTYNVTAQDMLRSLPGINSKNVKHVMNKVHHLRQLFQMSEKELQSLIGEENGRLLFQFINKNIFKSR